MTESRSNYKTVWTTLSETERQAVLHVIGDFDEPRIQAEAEITRQYLDEAVGILPDDVILEIGCGIGRVGQVLAPRCKQWIGCDVSPNMLAYAKQRLAGFDNVRLVELSGFDLQPIASASVDLVYCTVVFMHLEEWDRYNYIAEAQRVLRPGGRIFVDNFNLCSDEGWAVFETHRRIPPSERPPHISKSSTPQELETYLYRAGFQGIHMREQRWWVQAYGVKPLATQAGDMPPASTSPVNLRLAEHERELARLHVVVAAKNMHIERLEQLLAQIERGRLMRIMRWLNRSRT